MGQNFDDYSDFQKIPGMPILLQHSVTVSMAKTCNFDSNISDFNSVDLKKAKK